MKPSSNDRPCQRELDELYEAFAGARKPRLQSINPVGYDAEWFAQQPLRELSPALINEFVFELGLSVGDSEDVRYFLPRLFDLVLAGDLYSLSHTPLEALTRKVTDAGWRTWSGREREAVRNFLLAFFEASLAARDGVHVTDLRVSYSALFGSISPLLERVRERDDVAGVLALLWLAEIEGGRRLANLETRKDDVELREWLLDPACFAQVESLKARVGPTAPDGEDLSWLFEQVAYWLHICAGDSR